LFEAALLPHQRGDGESAARRYEEAIALDPGFVEAMVNLGWVHAEAGRIDEAWRWVARARETRDGYPGAHLLAGWLSLQAGELDRAVDELSQARALAPDDPVVLANLGVALQRTGRQGEARQALERSIHFDAQMPGTWLALALVEEAEGRTEHAISAWQRFIATAASDDPSLGTARDRIRFLLAGGEPGAGADEETQSLESLAGLTSKEGDRP
jgi:Flp pilus assembly protein TadD